MQIIKKYHEFFLVVLILIASFSLNIWNIDMDFQHPDEMKKGRFIKNNNHDFHHPALMTQVPWVLNKVFNFTEKKDVIVLGRVTSAVYGTLIVLFMYLFLRPFAGKWLSLLSAFSIAVSPIMVVHAHYFKEDMIFSCFAMLTLWAMVRFFKENSLKNGLIFGVVLGLVLSSQYKAVLLIPLSLFLPLFGQIAGKRRYYLYLLVSFFLSAGIFAGVNYLIFRDIPIFLSGLNSSTVHALKGNVLKIFPLPHFFTWHFVHSIIPGISFPLALIAVCSLAYSLICWKKIQVQERVLLAFIFVYYIAVEATPLKAFPGYIRYVVPIIPGMIYFACKTMWVFLGKIKQEWALRVVAVFFFCILIYPLYDSVNLVYNFKRDTRKEATDWVKSCHDKLMVEKYVYIYSMIGSITEYPIEFWQLKGYKYLVASSFMYDRYLYGEHLDYQDQKIYEIAKKYRKIFDEYPYREIKPKYRTFAFSNPTIRIIDIRPQRKKKK